MSTKKYQIMGDIVTKPQLVEALKDYIPTSDEGDIVSWIAKSETGVKVTLKDGREIDIEIGSTKDFEQPYYDPTTNMFHFPDSSGNDVFDPVYVPGGTGTGTGTAMRLTNQNGSTTLVGSYGSPLSLMFTFTSTEDDLSTGNGTCKIIVNNVTKATMSIPQGLNSIDVSPYLNAGTSTVKVTVTDIYGTSRSITYSVTVIQLSIESNFNAAVPYEGDISFKYTPYGSVEKKIHFLIDGTEIGTVVTSLSGKQATKTIPALPHGSHRLEVYSTATLDETELRSKSLVYDLVCIETGDNTPMIASAYTVDELEQGSLVSIPYIVYDPTKLACDISLTIYTMSEGSEVVYATQNITVDRSQWEWNTRKYPIGEVYFRIKYGNVVKTHKIKVIENSIKIEPETTNLELQLSSEGRSNNETNPSQWKYGNISTTFQNMNWSSTGWVTDDIGDTCLRLNGDARAEINFKPFASDIRTSGKTIEIDFAIRDVHNRSAIPISCMSGDIGFEVKPDTAYLKSEQSEVFCNYKANKRVKVAFTIESRDEYRLLSVYLNGVRSDAVQYPSTDNFQQSVPVNISIGSSDCGIDIYNIRSYTSALTSEGVTTNFMADITDIVQKTEVFEANDIYDEYGDVTFNKAKAKNSVMVIVGDLPKSKGDKKKVRIEYYDIEDSNLDFTEDDVTIDVQGTSSQWYVRKNWKLKFAENHYIDFDELPAKVICIKVDYAEATGTHNTHNAVFAEKLYSESIPPQAEEPKCRTTIYGKPILLFHQADSNSEPEFYGKSNFNYDKGAEHVFGFTDKYDVECWEFKNNTSDACNFLGPVPEIWVEDFEARYPEETTEIGRFREMHNWVVSTRRDAATGAALTNTFVDADGVNHTHDTAEYRLAKFKMEFENHFNMHYSLVYYVYTFFALMVDQRAKNMFLTYWASTGKWYPYLYDNDTCFGINNEGQLVLDYYHEDTDQLEGANVYNGQNSVLWCNFRDAFPDKIKETYQDLRSNSVLNYDEMINQFKTEGSDKWSESIYNEDADFKYISMLYSDNDASNLGQVRGTGEEHLEYFLENRFNYCDGKWYASDYADDYVALRIYTPVDENGIPRTDLAVAANADITVTPFSHMYAGLRYKANGILQQKRVEANEVTTFDAPNETFNDTETAIYGASQLSSLGDLSPLYCGSINVSKATKLTELIIGNNTEGYSNPNLNDLSVGTNNLLKVINVRNCPKLTDPLGLSGCPNIEEIYAGGSGITGVELSKSGYVKTIELPATIANLTLTNQLYIETLTLEGYDAIKTIQIENCPTIDSLDILSKSTNLERVRLTDVDWTYDTAAEVIALSERDLAGIDENGTNTDTMWIDGKCHIKKLTGAEYLKVKMAFPYLTITYDELTAVLTYMTESGQPEFVDTIPKVWTDDSISVAGGAIEACVGWFITDIYDLPSTLSSSTDRCPIVVYTPYKEKPNTKATYMLCYNNGEHTTQYAQGISHTKETDINLSGFYGVINQVRFNISKDGINDSYAYCKNTGDVLFAGKDTPYYGMKNINDNPVLCTQTIINGADGIDPTTDGTIEIPTKESTAQYHFTFGGWSLSPNSVPDADALKNVEADRTVYVAFNKELRKYTVKFYNHDGSLLLTVPDVSYGSDAAYTGSTPVNNSSGNPADFEFYGWNPAPTNIQGDTNCYAQFHDLREITDSWATIAKNVANGTATSKYSIGAFKELHMGELVELPGEFYGGSAVVYNNEIHILGSLFGGKQHYKWDGNEWVSLSNLPIGVGWCSAVVYNDEIHIIGNASTGHYKYDGSTWTSVSTLPYSSSHRCTVVYNNEIHILGGDKAVQNHYKWDGNEWVSASALPYDFQQGAAIVYNNEIHLLGGHSFPMNTNHYKWDGTTWQHESDTTFYCKYASPIIIDGEIHVVGSIDANGTHYKYSNSTWTLVENLPHKYTQGCVVQYNDTLYTIGGRDTLKHFYYFNPETSKWIPFGTTESIPMQIVAHNHDELPDGVGKWEGIAKPTNIPQYGCAVTYQNEVHALGGNSSSSYTQHIKWDATNSTWVTVSTLPYQFRSGCALVLNDEIHILGSYQTTNKTEHYKWNATDGWVSVSTLPYSFYCSSAVVLNNEIHILGSYDSSCRKYHYKWNGTEWTSVSTLPYNFYYGSAVVYNGEIHIFSGSGSSTGH